MRRSGAGGYVSLRWFAREVLMDVLRCFLAFLVPPLPVYLQEGLSKRHWLTLLLTLVGFVPGVALALYTVFQHASRPSRNEALEQALHRASEHPRQL